MTIRTNHVVGAAIAIATFGTFGASSARADGASDASEAANREAWRDAIAHAPSQQDGCFHASYPSMTWSKVDCIAGPTRAFRPRSGSLPETVGNGADFAAESATLISQTVGTFPTVTGVTSETDGRSNTYSIQLNSNFMSGTAACNGVSGCLSWSQFVYSSSEKSAFMQYWLIGIGTCPKGGSWINAGGGDCYKNSAAVSVPKIAITDLANLKMSGTAVKGGNDTLVFTNGTEAYTTSGKDTVTDLATDWEASEFNVIGDGGGSEATFNSGASVKVKIAVTNGSTAALVCAADDGTTGETNNLNLGTCSGAGGAEPYIEFTESNAR
jgi:hypothetical protein